MSKRDTLALLQANQGTSINKGVIILVRLWKYAMLANAVRCILFFCFNEILNQLIRRELTLNAEDATVKWY